MPQQFASDNNAGICPEALDALLRANDEGHVPGYGDDAWTQKACARLRELFETDAQVFFVFNGTAANALALAQLCQPYHAVIAHAFSHIEEDEAGAAPRRRHPGSRSTDARGREAPASHPRS